MLWGREASLWHALRGAKMYRKARFLIGAISSRRADCFPRRLGRPDDCPDQTVGHLC